MSFRTKAQAFGAKLSGMVIPNLGAFIAWGLVTAVGIAIGSDLLKSFIVPMLNYLLPLLIAFAGGRMVYDYRGGVIATIATMGVIVGAEITMFLGAMIVGPLAAYVLKKFDELIDGKIPMGFELLINNFGIAIIGTLLAVFANQVVAPFITSLTFVMSGGVNFLVNNHLLPLTAIFIEPAKILFLNNAIGQGILSPLGTAQLATAGKSVLYLLESNPGPGMGVLLAYMLVGKGNSRASAYGAGLIHFFGGIHEIYFPYVLMNPILVLPLILGGITGTFMFTLFQVGLVGVAAPGSILALFIMSAQGDHLQVILSVLAATAVSFVTAIPFVKRAENNDAQLQAAAKEMESLKGKKSSVSGIFEGKADYSNITSIAYVCDAGVGSSTMGANILQKRLKEAGIEDIKVFHASVMDLPAKCELIVTHESLMDRVKQAQANDVMYIAITDYINAPQYKSIIDSILASRK
ncbi:MAG: PTS transporter subunit EIIC [Brevinema sp.]